MKTKTRNILLISAILFALLGTICCAAAVLAGTDAGMSFDGLAEYKTGSVEMPLPLTYEATVRFPEDQSGAGGVIFGSYADDNTSGFNFAIGDGGAPSLYVIDAGKTKHAVDFDGVSVYTGEKVHIAIALDRSAGSYACYINGELVKTVNASVPSDFTTIAVFNLGTDNTIGDLNYFRGELFGVALYADARGAEEIANDAKGGVDESELIAAYSPLSKGTEEANVAAIGDAKYNLTYTCVWMKAAAEPENYDYSMAVIGDIQSMTYYYPDLLLKQFEWIRDNAEAKKIAFSVGLGDITEMNTEAEYLKVVEAYDKIDGKIPFSIIRGNHDRDSSNSTELYDKYISIERYGDEITGSLGGTMRDTYRIIEIGSVKYMFVNLDLVLSDEAIAWANEIISEHPECHVIVSTHAYKNSGGSYFDHSDGRYGCENNPQDLWNELLSQHENIVLMLYGHAPKDAIGYRQRTDTVHGNTVTEMLINPQDVDHPKWGGTGLVAMLYFSNDGRRVDVRYYSTAKDAYFTAESQFGLKLDTPDAPDIIEFEDVIMNVGSCESERNLTWYSQYEGKGEVRYGKSTDGKLPENYMTVPASSVLVSKDGTYSYKATLVGLEENSTYAYTLVVGDKESEVFSFNVYGIGDEWSFAFVTDPQVRELSHAAFWDDTLYKIKNEFDDVSFIVSGGDQTNDPDSEESFDWFISKYLSSIAIATTMGPPHDNTRLYTNHYNLPNLSSKYGASSLTSDYYYTYNNVLFMHLNVESSNYAAHGEFLENSIRDNPECLWRVVVIHYSFFTGGDHSTDSAVLGFRNNMAGKFAELGIDVVLSGHDHIYSRSQLMMDGTTVSSDVVTDNTVTDPEGVLYICGTSSTGTGWYTVEHNNDDQYIAYREDENRKSVTIFSVTETSLTLKTYFIDGSSRKEYDSFTINKTKDTVRVGDGEMLEILDGGARVPLVNAYLYDSAIVKVVGGYWSLSTNGGSSFTSLGIASTNTNSALRINEQTRYWELSTDGGSSFAELPIYSRKYTVEFIPLQGATYGDSTDLSVFADRRFTYLTPDAPTLNMDKGSLEAGIIHDWYWEYYLVGGDGSAVTEFVYGKEYVAYPVSNDTRISNTLYIDTVSNPDEYTYTWVEAWDLVNRFYEDEFTLVMKSNITLKKADIITLKIPANLTIDLAGKRLNTSAVSYAIRFATGSSGAKVAIVTSTDGGSIYSGTNDVFQLASYQKSVITIQYGSEDTKPLTVERAKYLVGANSSFRIAATLNLTVYPGNYTVDEGIIYITNGAPTSKLNNYMVDLNGASFNFLGASSAIVRTVGVDYKSSAISSVNAVGCTFTDIYSTNKDSSRAVFSDDVWCGTASFVDCDFVGMSIGTNSAGALLENCGIITVGDGCTFTNSSTSFNTGTPLSFISSKIALASGCVLARTDASGSIEVLPLSDAVEITWENPVGYKEYWKRGVTPAYLGETSFTVGEATYSLVLIETPTAANENKAYAFKSAEGYLYRYDEANAKWQISIDGGNSYTNLDGSGATPPPAVDPDYGCTVEIDGVVTTFGADEDFYNVLKSFNVNENIGKTVKITLGADMSFKTKPTFNRAITVEIDLAGHTLTYEAAGVFQIGATKFHIYSSVAGGELTFKSEYGFQPVGGAIIFGSEEYKNNLTVSAVNDLLGPKQTADGKTLHFEFLYCTVNFGASNLIRINAIGAGTITLEMKIVGCTVTGDKNVICYNYTSKLAATTNGGVCGTDSYINVIDSTFTSTTADPIGLFGSDNFTDRYFGTVSFEGTTFNNFVLNGELIYSDEVLSYNEYYNTIASTYDPTKAITVGKGCVFNNYGTTFTEDLSAFTASNVSLADGCMLSGDSERVTVSTVFGCTVEIDGVVTKFDPDEDFYNVLKSFNTNENIGKTVKITLGSDMSFKTKPTFNRAITVEIDLVGHTLTYEAAGVFQLGATKLHIYSSVAGGELTFKSEYGFQPVGGAIIFGSEEYKNNLTVSAVNDLLCPKQTADGKTLHFEFLYCTVNFGASNLIRINAIGAGTITLEMKIEGCTVNGDKSVICYNYTTTLGATTNGGVCGTDSYINVIDSTFTSTTADPIGFFGSDNFTDRYFGTVSFEGTTFDNYVLNGELIYSDAALSYNTYFDTLTGYDPTKAITVGKGCVFKSYGATFTEDMTGFSAKNVSVAEGYAIKVEDGSVRIGKEFATPPSIGTVSVTVSSSLAMNYTVTLPTGCDAAMLMMEFTMNGRTFTVYPSSVAEGTVTFVFTRIAPQCMGDSIGAVLYYDGEVVDTHGGYSVKAYAEDLLELYGDNEQVTRLVIDMLNYGAAAQAYVGYKTDAPVNAGLSGAGSTDIPTESDKVSSVTASTNANYGFSAAGVRFDYVNKIFVKLKIADGAPIGDAVTVLFDGVEAELRQIGEGEYIAYSGGISALSFGKTVTATLSVNGETVQTLTYSVNSYVYAKHGGTDAMADLALALYRYGLSAVAYEESIE